MAKYSFLDEKIVYQSFYDAPLTVSSFSSSKISVSARIGKSLAKCLLSEDPCWKNYISGFIWHKSFIQMVKCSSVNQRIVYQSFYGAVLSLNYFFFKEKFVFYSHASASCLQDVYCLKRSEDLCWKNDISAYIWHKLFIQTVKCSSFNENIVYQSFYGTLLMSSYFFFKFCVL